ncbi:hypothetical protein Bhyg_05497 [Pseudolycoriella hygida]|uniref:Uncharacterized protein n=1 Tax=Pseudolycoriella hygida TaxID=35572 RepID=A0A9Q0MZ17_9DIPT|nr:hypothetical protein Bhyg_05497 [Pseudolycoriella hygida]
MMATTQRFGQQKRMLRFLATR